ncbi:alpha amylase C-terminal domain-containing protein, partial [Arthrospira platensis SPKY1]|nr:alpha amylase C-terminal domain-containing protein [Arthrospira platensis SPKY1]
VPHGGAWREVINTDSSHYGGGNVGNHGQVSSDPVGMHQQSWSLSLTLPPLAVLWLQPVPA